MARALLILLVLLSLPAQALQWRVDGQIDFDGVLILETTSQIGEEKVSLQATYMDSWPGEISNSNDLVLGFDTSLALFSSTDSSMLARLNPESLKGLKTGPRSRLTRFVLERSALRMPIFATDIVIPLSLRKFSYSQYQKAALLQIGSKEDVKISDLNYDNLQLRVFGTETPHADWTLLEDLSSEKIPSDHLGPIEVVRAFLSEYSINAKSPCGREVTRREARFSPEFDLARPHLKIFCIRLNRARWVDFYEVYMRFRALEVDEDKKPVRDSEIVEFECKPFPQNAHRADFGGIFSSRKDYWDILLQGDCEEKIRNAARPRRMRRGHQLVWLAQVFLVPRTGNFPTFEMDKKEIAFVQLPRLDWFEIKLKN